MLQAGAPTFSGLYQFEMLKRSAWCAPNSMLSMSNAQDMRLQPIHPFYLTPPSWNASLVRWLRWRRDSKHLHTAL